MLAGQGIRVRVAALPAEARRLCTRLTRGGIAALPDDGESHAEVLVAVDPKDLAPYRSRATKLLVVGAPGGAFFAAGADEVVVPGEPELLFRRLRGILERIDLLARVERQNERIAALEGALADAAHDVRSPLQAVIGNAELLAKEPTLTADQREMAAAALRQSTKALLRAERILESARGRERVSVDARPLDLGQLVESVAEQGQTQARARGVVLTAVPPARPVEVRADPELLSRLLDNLVGNAIRVLAKGGHVEVSAWRSSPKTVRLSVKDDGPGIPPADLPKLIAGLGTGRGLRIVRGIAEQHGGDFWAESNAAGTRFTVEIPLAPQATRPRVLLVSEDNKWVKEVTRTLATACDVRSSTPAQARLGKHRTDLVLIDPSQPLGKKLDALRIEAKDAQVPVIELPGETAAARLARTLAQLAP